MMMKTKIKKLIYIFYSEKIFKKKFSNEKNQNLERAWKTKQIERKLKSVKISPKDHRDENLKKNQGPEKIKNLGRV